MDSNRSSRRRFLKQAAALAGVATGGGLAVRGQSAQAQHLHGELPRRGARYTIDHMTHYTPLQDYAGIITPAPLHFMQQHSSEFPEIDVQQHRVTIHGLVDRPLSFSMADLKQLPSVSRIHFLECHGNSSPAIHGSEDPILGLPVQFIHGMTSCSEWSGVLLSVLLNEVGVHKGASWLVSEGGDAGKFTHTLPLAKAMEDVIVAYGQNGDPLRVEIAATRRHGETFQPISNRATANAFAASSRSTSLTCNPVRYATTDFMPTMPRLRKSPIAERYASRKPSKLDDSRISRSIIGSSRRTSSIRHGASDRSSSSAYVDSAP